MKVKELINIVAVAAYQNTLEGVALDSISKPVGINYTYYWGEKHTDKIEAEKTDCFEELGITVYPTPLSMLKIGQAEQAGVDLYLTRGLKKELFFTQPVAVICFNEERKTYTFFIGSITDGVKYTAIDLYKIGEGLSKNEVLESLLKPSLNDKLPWNKNLISLADITNAIRRKDAGPRVLIVITKLEEIIVESYKGILQQNLKADVSITLCTPLCGKWRPNQPFIGFDFIAIHKDSSTSVSSLEFENCVVLEFNENTFSTSLNGVKHAINEPWKPLLRY